MRNILLKIAYDGTKYCGWQIQRNGLSVQEVVETALSKIIGENPAVIGCSRTDAGVHAKEFCCNFKTMSNIPLKNFPLALNAYLPDDIAANAAIEVPDSFHARFDCRKKEYLYKIYLSEFKDPFLHNRAYRYGHDFNLEEVKKAAAVFVGTHDFEAFAAANRTTKTTVRTIYSFDVEKKGNEITFSVCGDGFLYNMVRIMAGTLLFVARGKLLAEDVENILVSKKRERAGPTAPAHALYLNRVFYDEKESLYGADR